MNRDSIKNYDKDTYYITYTRSGIFKYKGWEVNSNFIPNETYEIYRTKSMIKELFNRIKNREIPLTADHRDYTGDPRISIPEYYIGDIVNHTMFEYEDIIYLGGLLKIKNKDLFKYETEKNGKSEISSDFDARTILKDGKYYHIISNIPSVALVARGRAQTNTICDTYEYYLNDDMKGDSLDMSLKDKVINAITKCFKDNRIPDKREIAGIETKLKSEINKEGNMFSDEEKIKKLEDENKELKKDKEKVDSKLELARDELCEKDKEIKKKEDECTKTKDESSEKYKEGYKDGFSDGFNKMLCEFQEQQMHR